MSKVAPVIEEAINQIMDQFNFARVHRAMTILDWKWDFGKDELRVPEEYELRRRARELLRGAAETEAGYFISSGGFKASREQGALMLEFVLEEWWEDIDD